MIGITGSLSAGYRAKGEKSDAPRGMSNAPREMTNVTCTDCGQQTQVPFKPSAGRPVFCRDCFSKHKPKDKF